MREINDLGLPLDETILLFHTEFQNFLDANSVL